MSDDSMLAGDAMIFGTCLWGCSQIFPFDDHTNMASSTVLIPGDNNGPDLSNVVGSVRLDTAATNQIANEERVSGGGQQYEHEIAFGAPSAVNGDETPWVSIGATLVDSITDGCVWLASNTGDIANTTDFFDGNGFVVIDPVSNDLAVEIIGVPEPGTAALIVLGALGFGRRRGS